ncbi:MAG: histidine phosphatase family protein [Gammaproteobacteria bacterium]|nr:histidine phosphatase family protein [Gammaproteobacteria bacterium]
MKSVRGILILCLFIVTACASQSQHAADPLVQKLQQGGYVIFFRHAATDHSQQDTDKKNLANCETQRPLTDEGRQQARVIGEGFTALNIPVGNVITSYYCRCIDTARIAFGKATPTLDITSIQDVTPDVKQQRIANLRQMLNTPPAAGANTVLVAHKWMFNDASGYLLEEGEAAIFQPQDSGEALMVKRVKPDEWKGFGKSASGERSGY